ncbi:hypothetical protein SUGI_0866200 [Cryptomeria japonica]|nr:hypothetical protein SUGI_0866200 [Cryptomeria japonica]
MNAQRLSELSYLGISQLLLAKTQMHQPKLIRSKAQSMSSVIEAVSNSFITNLQNYAIKKVGACYCGQKNAAQAKNAQRMDWKVKDCSVI